MALSSKETIVVVGYGWVGQANALALSKAGYRMYYFDVQKPELRYADKHREQYDAIKPLSQVLEKDGPDTWYMVCVGDRVMPDGEQDISAIRKALEPLKHAHGGVILRSTVLPVHLKTLDFDYYVPEFLHEKKAIEECMVPHYFIVGSRKKKDGRRPSFFDRWERAAVKTFYGTPEEASYLKYLSNIWNSLRIAFVNEFGNAMALPTDAAAVNRNETLINFLFEEKGYLRYGRSYGGHCLPKDTHAFAAWHKKQGKDMSVIEGVHLSNLVHKGIEEKHPYLPEWFSDWVRPQMSGRVALSALRASVARNVKKYAQKPFTGKA